MRVPQSLSFRPPPKVTVSTIDTVAWEPWLQSKQRPKQSTMFKVKIKTRHSCLRGQDQDDETQLFHAKARRATFVRGQDQNEAHSCLRGQDQNEETQLRPRRGEAQLFERSRSRRDSCMRPSRGQPRCENVKTSPSLSKKCLEEPPLKAFKTRGNINALNFTAELFLTPAL